MPWGIAGSRCSNPIVFRAARTKKDTTELLALYKQPKPGEVFVKSQDTEDSGGRVQQLGKVGTDDLGFSWPSGTGGSPPKKKANAPQAPMQKEAIVEKQATAQAQLAGHIIASCCHA